jgi:hypothetical protein
VLVARIRRHTGAEGCSIVPNRTRYYIMSYEDFFERTMRRTVTNVRNVGTQWETIEVTLQIPDTIPNGTAEMRVTAYYTNCDWQDDGRPPVVQTSPPFKVEIIDEQI